MLYHKLHWGPQGGAEFLVGALNRPCHSGISKQASKL